MLNLCPAGSEGWGPLSPSRPIDFTSCFQYGVLSVGLSVLLLVTVAVRLFLLRKEPTLPRGLVAGGIFHAKILAAVAAAAISATELAAVWNKHQPVSAFTIAMALQSVAAAAAALLHGREQLVSRVASTPLLLYWLSAGVLTLVRLRTAVATGLVSSHPAVVAASGCYVLVALLIMILECRPKPLELYELLDDVEDVGDSEDVQCLYRAPDERAHIFSRLVFSWLEPVLDEGVQKTLQLEDMCELSNMYYPEVSTVRLQRNLETSMASRRPRLMWTTISTYRWEWVVGAAWLLVSHLVPLLHPLVLARIIGFVTTYNTDQAEPIGSGYIYATAMFAIAAVTALAEQQKGTASQHLGLLLRTGLLTTVYRKSLSLSNNSRKAHNIGGIVSHIGKDVNNVTKFVSEYSYTMFMAPLKLILTLYMLHCTLGWSIFVGALIMAISIPIIAPVVKMKNMLTKEQMEYCDKRIKIMNEVVSGIRIIKLYAWESSFMKRINQVRQSLELKNVRRAGGIQALLTFNGVVVPVLVAFSTYCVYSIFGNESHGPLDSKLVFVSLALLNMLKAPLSQVTSAIPKVVDSVESYHRIHDFLSAEEIDFAAIGRAPYNRNSPTTSTSDILVSLESATFKWLSADNPVLKYIGMQCRRNELVAVIGRVGSGKSSLVSAILGDMVKCSGSVVVCGSIAFAPQQPWIMNATLRDNILFGNRFDKAFYDRVLHACALSQDIKMLPAGDQTEIGENGINLSGGQKSRVSLARAVYARADVYLLDDPLAAVDAHVAKHIFTHVLGQHGLLKSRTRILTTNAVQYLSSADNIVMLHEGEVVEQGTLSECMERMSEVYKFIHKFIEKHPEPKDDDSSSDSGSDNNSDISSDISSPTTDTYESEGDARGKCVDRAVEQSLGQADPVEIGGALTRRTKYAMRMARIDRATSASRTTTDETSQQGQVRWEVYRTLLQACGKRNVVLFLVTTILAAFASVSANLWLRHWAASNEQAASTRFVLQPSTHSVYYYLLIYGAFGFLGAMVRSLQAIILWTKCAIAASVEIHENMLVSVMRAPMSFFDTTPVGRILNRFSSDVTGCDMGLPLIVSELFGTANAVITSTIIIGYSTPMIFVICLPLVVVYRQIQQRFTACSREAKRLQSTTFSPILAHIQESVSGASTIRAYGHQLRFVCENETRIEDYLRVEQTMMTLERWLTLRLEAMGTLVLLATNLLSIIALHYTGRGDAGMVGLAISYAVSLTSYMSWTVKDFTLLENEMTHVERAVEYSHLPQEAVAVIEDRRPDVTWPEQGVIEFRNYSTRYREGLDLVLKDMSFRVLPSQKVGIVGRTGAGKSSLTLALFRIIESAGGQILLDGRDISRYGLYDVRSRLSIIPQDPVLFAGTVRENLDPFSQYSDQEIWRALEHAHLDEVIREKDEWLEFVVAQGGENFSVGQRQLICLARALLKRAKVLVLDEATAAIDHATDALIQQTIREEFKSCTVLTIAHRLNTIIDNEMILVVDGGQLAEYDTPQRLLQNSKSLFSQLVREASSGSASPY